MKLQRERTIKNYCWTITFERMKIKISLKTWELREHPSIKGKINKKTFNKNEGGKDNIEDINKKSSQKSE